MQWREQAGDVVSVIIPRFGDYLVAGVEVVRPLMKISCR